MLKIWSVEIVSIYILVFIVSSCSLSEKTPVERADTVTTLKEAPAELDRIGLNTVVVTPTSGESIRQVSVDVLVDTIDSNAVIAKALLIVDGLTVAESASKKPWSFRWLSYYWGDGEDHSIKVQLVTAEKNIITGLDHVRVNVSADVGRQLDGLDSLTGQFMKEIDELAVSLPLFDHADFYILYVTNGSSESVISQESPQFLLTDLSVGRYDLQYSMAKDIDGVLIEGPASRLSRFWVVGPDLPEIYSEEVAEERDGYKVTFTWSDVYANSLYHFTLFSQVENKVVFSITTKNSELSVSGLDADYYRWTLVRENQFGQKSVTSKNLSFQVGAIDIAPLVPILLP